MRLWRESGQWRARTPGSTYWGTLRGALTYAWNSYRLRCKLPGGQNHDSPGNAGTRWRKSRCLNANTTSLLSVPSGVAKSRSPSAASLGTPNLDAPLFATPKLDMELKECD